MTLCKNVKLFDVLTYCEILDKGQCGNGKKRSYLQSVNFLYLEHEQ